MKDNFKNAAKLVAEKFKEMQQYPLFVAGDGVTLFYTYLENFKQGDDPVFRDPDSSEHNCNLDKNFIKRYGNVVAIIDNKVTTMWDIELSKDSIYYAPFKAMGEYLRKTSLITVFKETFDFLHKSNFEKTNKNMSSYKIGVESNNKIYSEEEADKFGVVTSGEVYTFYHFYANLNKEHVLYNQSAETVQGAFNSRVQVFRRFLTEISLESLETTKDLIAQGSLLNGETFMPVVEGAIQYKKEYEALPVEERTNWIFVKSLVDGNKVTFRNTLIGTLVVEIEEGKDLNEICKTFNYRVDPANYMKATAPITKAQIKMAESFVEEHGYVESFNRRHAVLEDININEILHTNEHTPKKASLFDKVKPTKSKAKMDFEGVEEVSIEKFMKDILPFATSVEALVTNNHVKNFVALTTAAENSKQIFKWNNPFSFTYYNNLAGQSLIKEEVAKVGGNVKGNMRFSIMWNEDGKDIVDLDAHCDYTLKSGVSSRIYFSHNKHHNINAFLDVDMVRPKKTGVENIVFTDNIPDGSYIFSIHNYDGRDHSYVKAEFEYMGEVYSFKRKGDIYYPRKIEFIRIDIHNGKVVITPNEKLLTENSMHTRNVWNIDTGEFYPVNLICLSPNYWGENNVGHKHYFFMLNECKSDKALRSFHIENLKSDLLQHRKVLEVLGYQTMIEPAEKQLCGLGFNATIPNELIVKIEGSFKRMLKIKF